MRSTLDHLGTLIDCRQLIISGHFHDLSDKQALRLQEMFWQAVKNCFEEDCVLKWYFDNRSPRTQRHMFSGWSSYECLEFQCYAKGSIVYDPKSFRAYLRSTDTFVSRPSVIKAWEMDYAEDYLDYYYDLLEDLSPDRLKEKIISLFSVPGKRDIRYYNRFDAYGGVIVSRDHLSLSGGCCGSFNIEISSFCLEDRLDEAAEYFVEFLRELALTFRNVNATIGLNSMRYNSWHDRYFGRIPKHFLGNPQAENFWRDSEPYYLDGVEWFNLISPVTRELFLNSLSQSSDKVDVSELENGALIVKAQSPVSVENIEAYYDMKKLVYKALRPGCSEISIYTIRKMPEWGPRSRWELMPVLEDEVTVRFGNIIFSHTGEFEPEKFQFKQF